MPDLCSINAKFKAMKKLLLTLSVLLGWSANAQVFVVPDPPPPPPRVIVVSDPPAKKVHVKKHKKHKHPHAHRSVRKKVVAHPPHRAKPVIVVKK